MFRRSRFGKLVDTQLDVFVRDQAEVLDEIQERLDAYNAADRSEAEELYGDYVDAVETGTELLADIRDHFARTLEEGVDEQYQREFNRAVAKRLPEFSLEIENR
jgi:hypothetical protein